MQRTFSCSLSSRMYVFWICWIRSSLLLLYFTDWNPIPHFLAHVTSLPMSFEQAHDKTYKMACAPMKTQIRLGIRSVLSESSLCAQWIAKDPSFLHANSEDSDQTGRMPRLILVFAGRTCHFEGFVMRWLKLFLRLGCLTVASHGCLHIFSMPCDIV